MTAAIKVEHVSKYYKLGGRRSGSYGTLRESITDAVTAPFRMIRRRSKGPARSQDGETDLWALKDVSFEIQPGESIGIIGRNGAGKSTLLKVMSRITEPTEGSLRIRGRVGSLLEVGTGFHPELTGRENVFLYGSIIGMSRREISRKFDQIVEFAEIGRFIDTPVKRYSSGMYVRLAFAVAAHMEPDILLIDEVLSVGDLAFQRKCMDHAQRMLDRDVTLLFVSHNMFSIKAICNRAIYLSCGKVAFQGHIEDAIRLYDQDGRLDMAGWATGMVGTDPSRCPIHIGEMEILDERGNARSVFEYGERMRIRLHYRTKEPIREPNFCITVLRSDNVACCNHNTSMDGFQTGVISGAGTVELLTPPIRLVSELYSTQILVWDSKFQHLHCAQVGKEFHVSHPLLSTEFGVFHEEAQWAWKH
jgi:lipopolysaccharide transport system ATP-binding protein